MRIKRTMRMLGIAVTEPAAVSGLAAFAEPAAVSGLAAFAAAGAVRPHA